MLTNLGRIVILGVVLAIGLASTYIFRMQKDNKIEELAEKCIEKQTGIYIDLTPASIDKSERNRNGN